MAALAEELIFGKMTLLPMQVAECPDINQATQLARAMVPKQNSEEMGPVDMENQEEAFLGRSVTQTQSVSKKLLKKLTKKLENY